MKLKLLPLSLLVCISILSNALSAQTGKITGKVYNTLQETLGGAVVRVTENNAVTIADSIGNYTINNLNDGKYTLTISLVGYEKQTSTAVIKNGNTVRLNFSVKENFLEIKEVTVTDKINSAANIIGKVDMQLRPVNSSQDLLRLVPGLFIAQHAGGGKAEQIFLRGFDVDHGTDFAISVDGMPVNMPSHAHGQGYADLHFLIPETVRDLEVNKGPYATKYGDMATAGAGEFKTLTSLSNSVVKLEYGSFNTKRALAMVNILNNKHLFSNKKEDFYVAGEYKYSDAYFENKQYFNRLNLFTKYTGTLNNNAQLSLTLSTFQSNWDASGQVPERKIADGTITPFGSIDPTEGGKTGRTNFNAVYAKPLTNGLFKTQLYYSRYDFNLYSNFTFFLEDSINGDQIQQTDGRNIFGFVNSLQYNSTLFGKKLSSTFGTGARYDNSDVRLQKTIKREYIGDIVSGKLNQVNAWLYVDENLDITSKLRVNLGARVDVYNFNFKNNTYDTASGNVTKAVASPKLNLYYTVNNAVQLFAKSGYGFHSNDARAVVVGQLQNTLPKAFGYEVGSTFKLGQRMLVNVALWSLDLESELVYVGDAGIVEASGRSRRLGVDFGARYQIANYWFVDADINLNNGKLLDEPIDANRIPLAPTFTSIGGISYKRPTGINGSLRYRYMGDRAAIEDNSIIAKGYFLADAVINYNYKKFTLGITAENVLNVKWKEAQFATESRLQDEAEPVNEIHYTPGTPFFIKGSIAYMF